MAEVNANTQVRFYGAKEALQQLQAVKPEIYKKLVEDIKEISEPAISKIQQTIPSVSPIFSVTRGKSGMSHNGRSAWVHPKTVIHVTPAARAAVGTTARLVQIETKSPGKVFGYEMIEMAGRGGWLQRRSRTRPYVRNGVTTSHAINGQAKGLRTKLEGTKPSRYVYPAVQKMLPVIITKTSRSIEKAVAEINRKLDTI